MKLNNKQTAIMALVSSAILSINLLLIHNQFVGAFGVVLYFFSLSLQLKNILSKKHPLSIFWSFFVLLGALVVILTGIYYVYAINNNVIIAVLWLPIFLLSFRAKGTKSPASLWLEKSPALINKVENPKASFRATSIKKLFNKKNILPLISVMLELWLFFQVYSHRTVDLMKSPWMALDPVFFLLYTLATAVIIFINNKNNNHWIKYVLTSIHLFLTYGIAAIIYPLGFGIDGFIHRATENYIQQNGFITPKQPFYIGQYSLIVWLSNISSIPIFYIDTYLVPAMAALFLPGAISGMLEKTFGIAKKYGFSLVFLLPFLFFINLNLTTPHNLSIFFSILSICAVLLCASEHTSWFVPLVISASSICVHPLLGTPLLIFTCLIYLAKKLQKNKIAFNTISALGLLGIIFAVPALFCVYLFITKNPLPEFANPLHKIGFFLELFKWPYWYSAKPPLIFELLYYWESLLAPLLIAIGIIAFFLNKQKNKILLLFPLTMAGFWVSAFFLRSWIVFPNIGAFEQGDYPLRLLKISLIWILPWAMYAVYWLAFLLKKYLFKYIHLLIRGGEGGSAKTKTFLIKICILAAVAFGLFIPSFILTISLYLSYPQENPKVHFPGYNVTISDFHAAEWISNSNKQYNYIVLSNPLIAVAAMTNYGFPKYFDTEKGMQSYYSTPSGSKLFEEYTQMWNDLGLQKKHMDEAMDFAGVKKAYFIIPSFWTKFNKIVEGAKKTADNWQSIDGGKIYIFTYIR